MAKCAEEAEAARKTEDNAEEARKVEEKKAGEARKVEEQKGEEARMAEAKEDQAARERAAAEDAQLAREKKEQAEQDGKSDQRASGAADSSGNAFLYEGMEAQIKAHGWNDCWSE